MAADGTDSGVFRQEVLGAERAAHPEADIVGGTTGGHGAPGGGSAGALVEVPCTPPNHPTRSAGGLDGIGCPVGTGAHRTAAPP